MNEYVYTVIKIEYDNDSESLREKVDAVYYDSNDAYNYVDEQNEFEEEGIHYRVDRHRVVFQENSETFSGSERLGLEKAAKIAERKDVFGAPLWAEGADIASAIRSSYIK